MNFFYKNLLIFINFLILINYIQCQVFGDDRNSKSQILKTVPQWRNYLDFCDFNENKENNLFESDIQNSNVVVKQFNEFYLGKFVCITVNNYLNEYKKFMLTFDGPALYRKIESNVCRKFPDNSDITEEFDLNNNRNIKIVIYSPWSASYKTEEVNLQRILSILLNGNEILISNIINKPPAITNTARPAGNSQSTNQTNSRPSVFRPAVSTQINENQSTNNRHQENIVTQRPITTTTKRSNFPVISSQTIKPTQRPIYASNYYLNKCQTDFKNLEQICVHNNLILSKIFVHDKIVWCIKKISDSSGFYEFKLSNPNFNFTSSANDRIEIRADNTVVLNDYGYISARYPINLAFIQDNLNFEPPILNEVKFNNKNICKTPFKLREVPCGRQNRGGISVSNRPNILPGDYPWLVSLFEYKGKDWVFICSGTVLNENTILTAAKCVHQGMILKSFSHFRVHLQHYNLREHLSTISRDVLEIIPHPEYFPEYNEYDLAILKLSNRINSEIYSPICLTNNKFYDEDQTCVIAGFGIDVYDEEHEILKQGKIKKIKNNICRRKDDQLRILLSDYTYCGEYEEGVEICPENHGSGLYCFVNDEWILSGVLTQGSGSEGRCSTSQILLFTDVSQLYPWITKYMKY